jgi:uncharacterized membrane protein YkoI
MNYLLLPAVLLGTAGAASAQGPDNGLIRMTQAIASAERHLSAHAMEAELETRGGKLVYEIELVRGSTLHRAQIDAHNGKLVAVDKPRMENWMRSWLDAERLRQGAKGIQLAERLIQLEHRNGGEVKEVEFEVHKGRGVYEVELVTNAGIGKVLIDAASGKRIELADSD